MIVAGRRREALDGTIGDRAGMTAVVLDIADAIAAFARRMVAEHPALNVLVNNAGVMRAENLAGSRDLADAEATIVTNLLGPIRLTDGLIGHLSGRADAAVVNVTSGLAFVPLVATPHLCGDQGDASFLHRVAAQAAPWPGRGDRAGPVGNADRPHPRPVHA